MSWTCSARAASWSGDDTVRADFGKVTPTVARFGNAGLTMVRGGDFLSLATAGKGAIFLVFWLERRQLVIGVCACAVV